MASQRLQLVLIVLALSVAARAQEAEVAVQNGTEPAAEVPPQPSPLPVEVVTEPPGQTTPPEVTEKPAETATAAPVDLEITPPPEVEDPLLAAKKVEGSPEFDQPAIFVQPDAIGKVPTGLGDECEEEAQCDHAVPESDCRDNICVCRHNYIFDSGRCWEKQMLGGNCNISLQCDDIEFATCAQGVCNCIDPYIPSPVNKCLQPAGNLYKAPCVEDIQCTHSYGDEARCSNSMCRCTNNYHFNGTTCIVDKKLGEVCETHEDCAVSDEGSRMCVGNNCTCADGYKTLPGEDICTRSSGEELAVSLTWVLCIVVAKYYLA
ncbi:prion-like-(Q/N-rich) domain-bearing protein 25 isoform X2 [Homalodisca vitripennis]|uniref:prion-like-(Q/N-rich) domain-bearing protein 25 isoform X2 n=1 Tax=Homalodisca vitripennis TaxID=197043 RepID=UPI001EEB4620|nr:prion-like-(Q/N-rich) domain-bearing protein 25 isoform X2 [Homalodisca vitripennis]